MNPPSCNFCGEQQGPFFLIGNPNRYSCGETKPWIVCQRHSTMDHDQWQPPFKIALEVIV